MRKQTQEGWGGKRITRAQWDATIRKREKEDRAALNGQVRHWTPAEIKKKYTDTYIKKLLKAATRQRGWRGNPEWPS